MFTRLGTFGGRVVGVETAGEEQRIVLANAGQAGLLAMVLAGEEPIMVQDRAGGEFAVVIHTDAVDETLMRLIDLLIEIRMHHPTMVQLPLALSVEDEGELLSRLQPALPGMRG